MERKLIIALKVTCILWSVLCAVKMLPKVLDYDATSAYGLGAIVGTLAAFLVFASPGIYAARVMILSRQKVQD